MFEFNTSPPPCQIKEATVDSITVESIFFFYELNECTNITLSITFFFSDENIPLANVVLDFGPLLNEKKNIFIVYICACII